MAETLEEPPYEVINAHDGFEVRRYGGRGPIQRPYDAEENGTG